MGKRHIVARGESVESLAYAHGLFWETVWNAPENEELRRTRSDPNALLEGDVVYVPDRRPGTARCTTGRSHRFRRKGVPSVLRVRLLDNDQPRAAVTYTVEAGGRTYSGTTDADGWLECSLMPDVGAGILRIDETGEELEFEVGTVRPADTLIGVQTRLRNLGFYGGSIDGEPGEDTRAALRSFQLRAGLTATGEADPATIEALGAYGTG